MTDPETITCPHCNNPLGDIVRVGGIELLKTGGTLARYLNGACAKCGQEVHFSVSDRKLTEILLKLRKVGSFDV